MDINKLAQSTSLNIKELKQIYENLASLNENTDGTNSNSTDTKLLSRILILLDNLEKPLQKTILQTWAKLNLALEEKNIINLTNYLDNNNLTTPASKEAAVKAFAFLLKNNLPLLPQLIKGIASNFNPDETLTQNLNNPTFAKSNLYNSVENNLSLNLQSTASEIDEQIKNYPNKIIDMISLLKSDSSGESEKLLSHLLGQQTLNIKESVINNNMLLNLEIPIKLPNYDQLYPLHLQIEGYHEQKKENKKNGKSFNISFIIELPAIGAIVSDIKIVDQNIYSQFLTTSKTTAELIKQNFHLLAEKLQDLGYNVNQPLIKMAEDDLTIKPQPLLEDIKSNTEQEYKHIDIKI